MRIDELDSLEIGIYVIFNSSHPSPERQSLSGRTCRIRKYDERYPKGWRKLTDSDYPHNISVCLQFTDDERLTFASIDEFEIVSSAK